jgi:hypothetical protein
MIKHRVIGGWKDLLRWKHQSINSVIKNTVSLLQITMETTFIILRKVWEEAAASFNGSDRPRNGLLPQQKRTTPPLKGGGGQELGSEASNIIILWNAVVKLE